MWFGSISWGLSWRLMLQCGIHPKRSSSVTVGSRAGDRLWQLTSAVDAWSPLPASQQTPNHDHESDQEMSTCQLSVTYIQHHSSYNSVMGLWFTHHCMCLSLRFLGYSHKWLLSQVYNSEISEWFSTTFIWDQPEFSVCVRPLVAKNCLCCISSFNGLDDKGQGFS